MFKQASVELTTINGTTNASEQWDELFKRAVLATS